MTNVLLCGNDKDLVDDFFCAESESLPFVFVSTTEHPDDIRRHLDAFNPMGFVYCVKEQTEESLIKLRCILEKMVSEGIKFFLVGKDEELDIIYSEFGSENVCATYSKEMGLPSILKGLSALICGVSDLQDNPPPQSMPTDTMAQMDFSDLPAETEETLEPLKIDADSADSDDSEKSSEKKRILIVDDDPNIIRTIKLYLQEDYSVAVATSGAVALKYLNENTADLVLLDYMMPAMDGPSVLLRIRNTVEMRNLPVIFLTGVSDREKIRQILTSNVQGYLLKPVDKEKLDKAIKKAFGEE